MASSMVVGLRPSCSHADSAGYRGAGAILPVVERNPRELVEAAAKKNGLPPTLSTA